MKIIFQVLHYGAVFNKLLLLLPPNSSQRRLHNTTHLCRVDCSCLQPFVFTEHLLAPILWQDINCLFFVECVVFCFHPSIHPLKHASASIRSSIHPSINPFIYPSIHLSIHPSIYSFIHPSIHLFIPPSIHPSLHIYPSIHQSIHKSQETSLAQLMLRFYAPLLRALCSRDQSAPHEGPSQRSKHASNINNILTFLIYKILINSK